MGALNDPHGSVLFASDLACTIDDPDEMAGRAGNATYTVTCKINARNSFQYRSVTLDVRALGEKNLSNVVQYLSGGDSCVPEAPMISNKLFGVASAASIKAIGEKSGVDGDFSTISKLAINRKPPYAFPDSKNALEDVLGLISALVVAKIPVTGNGVSAAALGSTSGSSTAIIEVTRLGSDSHFTLWLLLPPLSSLVILSWFFVQTLRQDWAPRDSNVQATSKESPELYTAESLSRIVTMGRSRLLPSKANVKNCGTPSASPKIEPLRPPLPQKIHSRPIGDL
ncbi:hypothetical protein SUNI508_10339 [Seiridium unicorne]|uniref:Uncharacterized protein n=1 Tax=Seiridium unicorne TaxID=138068 RepID=A0ABR2UMC1_9PEZI